MGGEKKKHKEGEICFSQPLRAKKYSRLYLFHRHAIKKVNPCINTSADECDTRGLSHEVASHRVKASVSQSERPSASAPLAEAGRGQM